MMTDEAAQGSTSQFLKGLFSLGFATSTRTRAKLDAQRGDLANLSPPMQKLVPPIETAPVSIRFLAGCELFDGGNQIPVAIHPSQLERLWIWLAFDVMLVHESVAIHVCREGA